MSTWLLLCKIKVFVVALLLRQEGNLEVSKQAMEEADELAHQKHRLNRLKEVAEGWLDVPCPI